MQRGAGPRCHPPQCLGSRPQFTKRPTTGQTGRLGLPFSQAPQNVSPLSCSCIFLPACCGKPCPDGCMALAELFLRPCAVHLSCAPPLLPWGSGPSPRAGGHTTTAEPCLHASWVTPAHRWSLRRAARPSTHLVPAHVSARVLRQRVDWGSRRASVPGGPHGGAQGRNVFCPLSTPSTRPPSHLWQASNPMYSPQTLKSGAPGVASCVG